LGHVSRHIVCQVLSSWCSTYICEFTSHDYVTKTGKQTSRVGEQNFTSTSAICRQYSSNTYVIWKLHHYIKQLRCIHWPRAPVAFKCKVYGCVPRYSHGFFFCFLQPTQPTPYVTDTGCKEPHVIQTFSTCEVML